MRSVGHLSYCIAVLLLLPCSACSPNLQVPLSDEAPGLDPIIDAVTPNMGPTSGGLEITIKGRNFVDGAKILIDGVEAEPSPLLSSTRLVAMLPARSGKWGSASVVVKNPDGRSTSRDDLFTYHPSRPDFAGSIVNAGSLPNQVVVGDFDGDHRADLAMANFGSDSVGILIGNGAGGVAASTGYAVGKSPWGLAVADFNGDERIDLVASNSSTSLIVLTATGAGTFNFGKVYPLDDGPRAMAVADINGDLLPDLIVTYWKAGRDNVGLLFGDGKGGFSASSKLSVGVLPQGIAVGDLNGDNKWDFVIADRESAVHVCLGDGRGGFRTTTIKLGDNIEASAISVGDWNGDTYPDLIVTLANQGRVGVLPGDGMGGFGTLSSFPTGANPRSLAVADFNGDQWLDLVVANVDGGTVSVLFGDGMGGLSAAANFAVSAGPTSVAIADFNSDQKPDLVVTSAVMGSVNSSAVTILLNQSQ